MAITRDYLNILDAALLKLRKRFAYSKIKTLCLSTPDLLIPVEELQSRYGTLVSTLILREDSHEILRYHGRQNEHKPLGDTRSFLTCLGLDPTFLDVAKLRGYEEICDLNEALPAAHQHAYDLILDSGTLEHCFNVGTAFKNMCEATALEGILITTGPVTMVNHGFWNFSPTAYYDGFRDNGFSILYLGLQPKDGKIHQLPRDLWVGRGAIPPDCVLYCVAQKTKRVDFNWPTQTKYKRMLSAKR